MKQQRILKGVNILKLLMAVTVVCIHTTDWQFGGLVKIAVPYFFCASGFFLFKKLEVQDWESGFWQWFKKAGKLYLLWTLVYLPYAIIGLCQDAMPLAKTILVYVKNIFFVGENYLSWPLWYLLSMLYAGLAVWAMKKFGLNHWMMLLIAGGLYIATCIIGIDKIAFLVKIFKQPSHILTGLLYMITGGCVYTLYRTDRIPRWIWPGIVALLGIAALHFSDWFIFPATASLFIASLNSPLESVSTTAANCCGSLSRTVYFVHMLFAGGISLLGIALKQGILFSVVAFLSMMTGLIIWKVKTSKAE